MTDFTRAALADPALLTDRFLNEWAAALPPEAAAALAGWRMSEELEDAFREFGERAGGGELSREQREAYREFGETCDMASIVSAAARRAASGAATPAAPPRTPTRSPAAATAGAA